MVSYNLCVSVIGFVSILLILKLLSSHGGCNDLFWISYLLVGQANLTTLPPPGLNTNFLAYLPEGRPAGNFTCPANDVFDDVPALTNVLPGWTGWAALDVQPCPPNQYRPYFAE